MEEKHFCFYCGEAANFQLKNGRWCCSEKFQSCPELKRKNSIKRKEQCLSGEYKNNLQNYISIGHKAWNKGLTKETDSRLKKFSERTLEKIANGELKIIGHKHSKETKEKLSIIRSEILSNNEKCGGFRNVKWYRVKNINNEEYVVRGTWEKNFALKLNSLNILWIKNKYLNYFINEVKKTYNPDFYLPELNEYIEVKGYFSKNDKIKMDAVIDQNPDVVIRFLQQKKYLYFIKNENAKINEIPIYLFGEFQSGYKRVGKKKIEKQEKRCLVCGKELKVNRLTYCSQECFNLTQRKIKISNEEKIELLKNFSISNIANKFNISYNAVKKWKKHLLNMKTEI